MIQRTVPDHHADLNELVQKAQESDVTTEEEIGRAETKLFHTIDKEARHTSMSRIIRQRERQLSRWRDIIHEADMLNTRYEHLGMTLEARLVRRIRDTYVGKIEDGQDDLNARHVRLARCL